MRSFGFGIYKRVCSLAMIFAIIFCAFGFTSCKKNKAKIIGVVQFGDLSHLNECKDALLGELSKVVPDYQSYKIESYDSGLARELSQIQAKRLIKNKAKVIVAIGEGSAIECATTAVGTGIPVIYSATGDETVMKRWVNINGISAEQNYDKQLEIISSFFPKMPGLCIGVVTLSSTIPGDQYQFATLREIANKNKILLNRKDISDPSNIIKTYEDMIKTSSTPINAILLLTNDYTASRVKDIVDIANANNIPVFGTRVEDLDAGCLCSCYPNYTELGKKSALQVKDILNGKYIKNLEKHKIGALKCEYSKDVLATLMQSNPYLKEPEVEGLKSR